MLSKLISTRSVLIVCKRHSGRALEVCADTTKLIQQLSPSTVIFHDEWPVMAEKATPDLVITVGGDGTLLRAASMFPSTRITFLPIAAGTLGFMLPLTVPESRIILNHIYQHARHVSLLSRLRLWARFGEGRERTALNEVNIHRGATPTMIKLDCHLDGNILTKVVTDGLLVATPTGSTAYSLSAGGPIVHPNASVLLLTPICPRSLSFRPVLLPPETKVAISISKDNQSEAVQVSVDGQEPMQIVRGEEIRVETSPFPIDVICKKDAMLDWSESINSLLSFNTHFVGRF